MLISNFYLSILAYFIGAYLKKFTQQIKLPSIKQLLGVSFLIYLLDLLSITILSFAGISFGHAAHFVTDNLAILLGISVFCIFLQLNIPPIKIINLTASTVFASYLITEQPLVRSMLWSKIVNAARFQNSFLLPIYGIVIVALIFVVCSLIDLCRQQIFGFIFTLFHRTPK
ncbi:hypothetical protein [Loigolactobacillus backii]|nr:hypothetical protein [Loigolactobacillus backii]